jgi:hypothetical protein
LNVSGCRNLTDTSILKVAESCPNIERLDISY